MKDELFSTSTSIFASSSCLHGKQNRAEPEAEPAFEEETLQMSSVFRSAGKPSSLLELLVTSIIVYRYYISIYTYHSESNACVFFCVVSPLRCVAAHGETLARTTHLVAYAQMAMTKRIAAPM